MKKCDSFKKLINEFIDEKLTGKELRNFEEHVVGCNSCRAELEAFKAIKRALAEIPDEELPMGFNASLHKKLENIEKEQKADGKIFFLNRKFLKIASTAAAAFLIMISVKSVFFNNMSKSEDNGARLTAESSIPAQESQAYGGGLGMAADGNVKTKAASSAEEKPRAAAANADNINSASEGSVKEEIKAKGPVTSQNIISQSAAPTIQDEGQNLRKEALNEIKSDNTVMIKADAASAAYVAPKEQVAVRKDSSLQIKVTDLNSALVEIGKLASSQTGEKKSAPEVRDSQAKTMVAADTLKTREAGTEVMDMKIPLQEYDEFLKKLKALFGVDAIVEKQTNIDQESVLKDIGEKVAVLDQKISLAEKHTDKTDPELLKMLKVQRENLLNDADGIRNELNTVRVSIKLYTGA